MVGEGHDSRKGKRLQEGRERGRERGDGEDKKTLKG